MWSDPLIGYFFKYASVQSAANDVKAKVQSIEASQNKINQVRQTMDKVRPQLPCVCDPALASAVT